MPSPSTSTPLENRRTFRLAAVRAFGGFQKTLPATTSSSPIKVRTRFLPPCPSLMQPEWKQRRKSFSGQAKLAVIRFASYFRPPVLPAPTVALKLPPTLTPAHSIPCILFSTRPPAFLPS